MLVPRRVITAIGVGFKTNGLVGLGLGVWFSSSWNSIRATESDKFSGV